VASYNAASFVLHMLKQAPLIHGDRRSIVRIDDVKFDEPSAAPLGLNFEFNVTIANEGSTLVTVKSFEFSMQDENLAKKVVSWAAPRSPHSNLEGQNIDGSFVRMCHVIGIGKHWHGETLKIPLFQPPISLQSGEVVDSLMLTLHLYWGLEGEDPGYTFSNPGERHRTLVSAIQEGQYILRATLHDGSFAYYQVKTKA
jgi:hypothetical protein